MQYSRIGHVRFRIFALLVLFPFVAAPHTWGSEPPTSADAELSAQGVGAAAKTDASEAAGSIDTNDLGAAPTAENFKQASDYSARDRSAGVARAGRGIPIWPVLADRLSFPRSNNDPSVLSWCCPIAPELNDARPAVFVEKMRIVGDFISVRINPGKPGELSRRVLLSLYSSRSANWPCRPVRSMRVSNRG